VYNECLEDVYDNDFQRFVREEISFRSLYLNYELKCSELSIKLHIYEGINRRKMEKKFE
jgi:hypothetical protein